MLWAALVEGQLLLPRAALVLGQVVLALVGLLLLLPLVRAGEQRIGCVASVLGAGCCQPAQL